VQVLCQRIKAAANSVCYREPSHHPGIDRQVRYSYCHHDAVAMAVNQLGQERRAGSNTGTAFSRRLLRLVAIYVSQRLLVSGPVSANCPTGGACATRPHALPRYQPSQKDEPQLEILDTNAMMRNLADRGSHKYLI
jgi:hypothetical protein